MRLVWIPKPDGRKRPLGIAIIRDRVVQTAVLLIIEPIFEADFMDCSYGFRLKRSAHDALGEVQKNLKEDLGSVYDADLKGYFDSIPQDKLIKCLRLRIVDRSVLKLISLWLQAPIVEQDRRGGGGQTITRNSKSTPQGGVISPLLANVYLHWFEKVFYSSGGPGNWAKAHIVRYAEDFVVMAGYRSCRLRDHIELKIESWLCLDLNREKMKVVNLRLPGTKLDFLGFPFRYDWDFKGRQFRYLNVTPSKKAVHAQREKLRKLINSRRSHVRVDQLIEAVNRQLRGWAEYFYFGYPRRAMQKMNWFVGSRLIKHLRRRIQRAPIGCPNGRAFIRISSSWGWRIYSV